MVCNGAWADRFGPRPRANPAAHRLRRQIAFVGPKPQKDPSDRDPF
jgi:hypothetical protein